LSEPGAFEAPSDTQEIVEEVETVADEILVEVKECQNRINQQTVALESLQSNGNATQAQIQELRTELANCREEMRNLLAELKALQVPALEAEGLRLSTPLPLPPAEEVTITPINPVEAEAGRREAEPKPKKKRYKI
jgi:predicted RNase H-like nuclease (RuvC/YqgF family)